MKNVFVLMLLMLLAVPLFGEESDTLSERRDYVLLKKSPTGAMLRSLALPGWGQLYVEHYWRSTVFAGGTAFLWYNVISNHLNYRDYKEQMNNIEDKNGNEYAMTKARRNTAVDGRDLSCLYLLGIYTLSIIDAYTGAHLYDFNMPDNVKLSIYPAMNLYPNDNMSIGIGLTLRY